MIRCVQLLLATSWSTNLRAIDRESWTGAVDGRHQNQCNLMFKSPTSRGGLETMPPLRGAYVQAAGAFSSNIKPQVERQDSVIAL